MARFDPTSYDLTDFDVARLATDAADRAGDVVQSAVQNTVGTATHLAREATYVTVGLGILTFQRAQVRRREIVRALRR